MKRLLIFLALTACAWSQPTMPFAVWKSAATPVAPLIPQDSLYVHVMADSVLGKNHGDTLGIWRNSYVAGNIFKLADSQKPTYRTNIINGKPAILFDGIDDIMQSKNNALGYKTGLSVYIVAKYQSTADNKALFGVSSGGYTDANDWLLLRTLGGAREGRMQIGTTVLNGAPDTLEHVHTMLFSASDSLVYYVDGTRAARAHAFTKQDLSAEIDIGGADNGGTLIIPANVYICEIAIYGGRHTNAVAKQIRDYLKSKWGTP